MSRKPKAKSKIWNASLLEEYEHALLKSRELQSDGSLYKQELLSMVTKKTRGKGVGTDTTEDSLFSNAFESVVIFAQYECGTGICVSDDGKVLSCAHVCGEKPRVGVKKVVIFMNGMIALLELIKVDIRCDVALFSISCILANKKSNTGNPKKEELPSTLTYPYSRIDLSTIPLKNRSSIICIGQPGRDDLESDSPKKTTYDLVCISKGTIVRVMEGDLSDNFEIGKLVHSAWTYWGHSGAALLSMKGGKVIGLHSSWDDEDGTRHGVHRDAIQAFLRGVVSYDDDDGDDEGGDEGEKEEEVTVTSKRSRARAIDGYTGEEKRRKAGGRRYSDAIEL